MSQSINTAKVPMGQKIAFGLGMLANQMFPAALGIFMVVLVKDLGFPGWMWSIIYFLPRVFDSITDPIMGFISDNTKSKWGRRKQYVIIGAVIMGISFIAMWQLYKENSIDYNFMYFILWSFVFYLGITIFSVPYVAMGYEMSNDFHERTNIMAIAQWIGQWAWVIAPWFWVIMYDPEWFASAEVATRTLAIWVGVICMILAMIPGLFIKSKSTLQENYSPLTIKTIGGSLGEIFDGFREAFRSKAFRKLCISTFLIFNAFNTVAAFSFFIVVYYLFSGDAAAAGIWPTLFGSLGALITTFAVIPTVAWMSKKIGKRKAFLLSQSISVFGYALLWFLFVPGKPYMFIFALPFFSFGIGSLFTLMMSMTADVIDLDELNTGKRREGIFGAIYWWMVKFGYAIAGGLSGVILSIVGFKSGIDVQTEEAITGLRAFFSGVPIIGTLIAIWVMKDYDMTEAKSNEIRAELDRRKLAKSSSAYTPGILNDLSISTDKLKPYNTIDFSSLKSSQIKNMFSESLDNGMHGLCFSPYLEGQEIGDRISIDQIKHRMGIVAAHTRWIRSFSSTQSNELIPRIAKDYNLKTMTGAWISNDLERNKREINSLISLAQQGYVDIATVGNEVLLRQDLNEEEILDYIKEVKAALPNIPVAYVDTYFELYNNQSLIEASDVILVNCYPFWEGSNISQSNEDLRRMMSLIDSVSNGKKIIITETGWPNKGESVLNAIPSQENAMKYFIQTQEWARNCEIDLFYFSSFDESWKARIEGEVGARWGLWDKKEQLKYM